MGLGAGRPAPPGESPCSRPTVVAVDLEACARNLAAVRERVGDRTIWAVVKANAYGHGVLPVTRRLAAAGADAFAVATTDEGVELREAGIDRPVLVLTGVEPLRPEVADAVAEHDLSVAVWEPDSARRLGAAGRRQGLEVRLHLKVDTGMGRLGCMPVATVAMARELAEIEGVVVEGVFSNLAAADLAPEGPGGDHTREQIDRFVEVCHGLETEGLLPPHRHLANSAALAGHRRAWEAPWCTGVRPGLALYGAGRTPGSESLEVEPVLSWRTRIAAVRDLPEGWSVGYGMRWTTPRNSRVAVLPVGYHDGWPRALGGRGEVLVRGRRAPIVGAVNMDLTLVDVTDVPDAAPGAPVWLIGGPEEGDAAIPVEEVATRAGSIAHEILSRIGPRVPRVYTGDDRGGRVGDPGGGVGEGRVGSSAEPRSEKQDGA